MLMALVDPSERGSLAHADDLLLVLCPLQGLKAGELLEQLLSRIIGTGCEERGMQCNSEPDCSLHCKIDSIESSLQCKEQLFKQLKLIR